MEAIQSQFNLRYHMLMYIIATVHDFNKYMRKVNYRGIYGDSINTTSTTSRRQNASAA